jgi:V/A-type H+/Na+-transporting ATPase subunit C
MSSDFGYINARIHGLKAKLLGTEFYNEALATSDFRSFMSTLGQSVYGREVEEAQSRHEGLKALDSALARNFYQTARSISTFSDGSAGELVGLLLLRYDLANIKAIARAKHAGRGAEDIQASLFPAGELKPAVLENVAAASDMAAVAQALLATPTPLRGAFARAAAQYQSNGNLYELELELDRAYFKLLSSAKRKAPLAFMQYVKREIDATNLRTALSLRASGGVSRDELFIPGGLDITRSIFDSLIADRSSNALQTLSGTHFSSLIETSSLAQAEEKIREVLSHSARRAASDPLDIGMVANYLRLKEAETAKLRLLGRGKFYNVPRQRLEQELGNA